MPWANLTRMEELYPAPSKEFPSAFNASSQIWRDAHMQCLVHNLATERTTALILPVWRYRFDLVAPNLNSLGDSVGAFHGSDVRFVMGQLRLLAIDAPFIPATPHELRVSQIMVDAWTNFIKGRLSCYVVHGLSHDVELTVVMQIHSKVRKQKGGDSTTPTTPRRLRCLVTR